MSRQRLQAMLRWQGMQETLQINKGGDGGSVARMATKVAARYGFEWKFVIHGFESRAHAKTKHQSKACRQARQLVLTDILDRYHKDATYASCMNTHGVAADDVAERKTSFQRRSDIP